MRIAILDDYQNCISSLDAIDILRGHEIQVVSSYYESPHNLAKQLNDPEALVLNRTRTPITSELLSLLPSLKVVSQTGKNAGHIDVKACQQHRVDVLEGRGDPTATAELTWGLIVNGTRLIPQSIQGMQKGLWQTNLGTRLSGKIIGIWGLGRIGNRIAKYAEAFGMMVMIWGSERALEKAKESGYLVAASKQAFFSSCDIISLHLRLKENTTEIVKYSDLSSMKDTALIVNTARSQLIERGSLLKALQNGNPGFAALDVYDEEPILDKNHPLLTMPNVICTPHMGYVEKFSYELYFSIAFKNLMDWHSLKV